MFIFFFLSFNFFFLFNTEDKQSQMLRNVFPFLRICVDPSPLAVPQGLKPILPNSCALLYSETGTHSITYKSRPAFPIFLLHFSKRIHLPHTNSVSELQLGASMGAAQLAVPLLSLARMTKAAFHGFLFFFFMGIVVESPAALHGAPCAQVFDLSRSFSINNLHCLSFSISGKIRTLHAKKDCLY